MSIKFTLLSFTLLLLTACSPKTTVVLLDSGKRHNAIIVSTDKGSKQLNQIGSFVQLNNKNETPSKINFMSKSEIINRYTNLFQATPKEPKTYIVYFKLNSTELTDKSKIVLEEALKTIKERSPCVVDIIGHTDTIGSNKINAKISLKRAHIVKSMIVARRIKSALLVAKGYGEEDLLMKTSNNVAEAKNRNVEIFIK